MRILLACLSLLSLALAAVALQSSIPASLASHLKLLKEAPTLTASVTVQPVGGAPEEWKISLGKPNLLRADGPDGFVLSDGKKFYAYSKKANAYSESPVDEALKLEAAKSHLAPWAAFFSEPKVVSARAGRSRNMKGVAVDEVQATFGEKSLTLFLDGKLGHARGALLKQGEAEVIVFAQEIKLGGPAPSFEFQAPSGATKAEAPKPDAGFAPVSRLLSHACMPCHGTARRSGGFEFTSYAGVRAAVVPGQPSASRLINSVSGPSPRMPKMRAPLSRDQVALLEKWVADGARE